MMTMLKSTCRSCGQPVAVVVSAPEPGSLADYFGQLEIDTIPDPVITSDEPCPRCGTALNEGEDAEHGGELV